MAYYHVEIGYRTKREAISSSMTVQAFGPDEAEQFARDYLFKGRPARKWCFTRIREATPSDIRMGVMNEPAAIAAATEEK